MERYDPITGWTILGWGAGIAGGLLLVGLVAIGLVCLWCYLIGETPQKSAVRRHN